MLVEPPGCELAQPRSIRAIAASGIGAHAVTFSKKAS